MKNDKILLIGNFLTSHGYNPTFMELLSRDLKSKYTIYCTSNRKNHLFRLFDMIFQYYKKLKSIKLVIIDTYSTKAYYYSIICSFFCLMHNRPYILILSGGGLESRLKTSYIFKKILKKSEINVSPSIYLYKIFHNYNTVCIPNYLDLNMYVQYKRTIFNPKFLWVRSIHEIYNPEMAIIVMNKIKKKYPNAELCMVGPYKDDTYTKLVALIKKYGLEKNIVMTGRLDKQQWVDLSVKYDIFLNTTNFDNHPVSILEAMALGMPIVSTDVGGISYFLEHNVTAKLVGKNDVEGMVLEINSFLDDADNTIKICKNARSIVEKKFSNKVIIPEWLKLIEGVLKKNNGF